MIDREKVIGELKEGIDFAYHRCHCGLAVTMEMALALLKEQEPRVLTLDDAPTVEPPNGQEPLTIQSGRIDEIYNHIAECPECGMEWAMWLPDKMRYCPGCGKAVRWDG